MSCACGRTRPHIIARRETADGFKVRLLSDGVVTWAFGVPLSGHGEAREAWSQQADLTAGWALMGLVELLDRHEVATAHRALRRLCRQPYRPTCTWRWSPDRSGPRPDDARRVASAALASPC